MSESAPEASELLAYEPFVRSIARALISDTDRIGDIVQETWLRALTKPLRQPGSIKSWLGNVARNVALDERRKDGNRKARERAVARHESAHPEERELDGENLVVQEVLALKEPYKIVVILHYFRDLSTDEIAAELGRNPATVRSQLYRAHQLLRASLDRKFDGEDREWRALLAPLAGGGALLGGAGVGMKIAAVATLCVAAILVSRLARDTSEASESRARVAMSDSDEAESALEGTQAKLDPANEVARVSGAEEDSILVTLAGVPVEGADVWVLDGDAIDPRIAESDPMLGSDHDRLFQHYGVHYVSGSDGRAHFPTLPKKAAIMVVHGQYLRILTGKETQVPELEAILVSFPGITVRVVDSRNQPVSGVPVVLRATVPIGEEFGGGATAMNRMVHRTEGGIATFRAYHEFIALDRSVQWSVRFGVPGAPAEQTRFEIERSLDDPIVLKLGSTEPLTVRTVDARGKLLPLNGVVYLRDITIDPAAIQRPLRNGLAHFTHVGIGAKLEATVEIPSRGASWKVQGTGAARAGEVATLDVSDPGAPTVVGRIDDVDGNVLANASLKLALLSLDDELISQVELETDLYGAFRAEIPDNLLGEKARFVILRYGSRGHDARTNSGAWLEFKERQTDLGTLRLREAFGQLEGRCVAPDGTPLSGIRVAVKSIPGFGDSQDVTNEDGEFHLDGVLPSRPILRVERADEWILEAPPILEGDQRNIELQLTRAGSIEGVAFVNSGIPLGQLEITAFNEAFADQAPGIWSAKARCDADTGAFRATGLHSGSYTLKVHLQKRLLRQIEGVNVEAPNASIDPRAQVLDLRGDPRSIIFRVVDQGGVPIRKHGGRVRLLADEGQLSSIMIGNEGRVYLPFAPGTNLVMLIDAPGYRSLTIEGHSHKSDIVLQRGIEVELTADHAPTVQRANSVVHLSLRRVEDDTRLQFSPRRVNLPSTLTEAGVATLSFPAPGRYELHYQIRPRTRMEGVWSVSPPQPVPGEFFLDVPDTAEPIALNIELPATLPQ